MPIPEQPVLWQSEAPAKPAVGAACNGCGLCCLAEPCPLGMWVSRRRHGPCVALQWQPAQQRYVCGMVADPGGVLGWRNAVAIHLVARLARRWIAAGVGCDADLQVEAVALPAGSAQQPLASTDPKSQRDSNTKR